MAKDLREGFSSAFNSAKDIGEKATKAAIKQSLRYAKASPEESKNTIVGAGVGAGIGFAIGGSIGVVGFFGGIGIPWVVLLMLSGGFLGNRFGISKDKEALDKKRREQGVRLEELIKAYDAARAEPKSKPAKTSIEVLSTNQQHREQLLHAFETAEKVVVVLCGWATSYVVDREFQRLLAKALKRGVSVYLGYGYQAANEPAPLKQHEKEAEDNLLALKEWAADQDTKGVLVVKKYPNHAKILICDDKYAVNGSFNWLSNAGRSRNIERSWLIKDRKFVVSELEIILSGLHAYLDKRDFLKTFVPWSRH